jgi:hypothetical protein
MRWRLAGTACLVLAFLTVGACNSPVPHEPGPDYIHDLPRCDDQGRLAHASAQDCTLVFGGIGFSPGTWLHVRFSKPGAEKADGAVTVDLYGDRAEPGVIRETGLKSYDYPFMTEVTGVSPYELVVPVQKADGRWLFSLWASDFLNDYEHHRGAYVHAGDIPVGRLLLLDPNKLLLETSSDFKGPWDLTVYRVKPSGIEPLGHAVAEGGPTTCSVTGDAAPLLKQSPDAAIQSICQVFSARRDYYDDYGQPGHFGSTANGPQTQ